MPLFLKSRAQRAVAGREEPIDAKESIQFWQKEVQYYEGRAGEQGASANRMVTLAVGATAAVALLANTVNAQPQGAIDVRVFLFAYPTVILLLWTSAIRLLHEMMILREYVRFAEQKLYALVKKQPDLSGYQSWAQHGGKHDMPYVITLVWFVPALGLSVAGTFGITRMMNPALKDTEWLGHGALAVAAVLLVFAFQDTSRDAADVAERLRIGDKAGAAENPSLRREGWLADEPTRRMKVAGALACFGLIVVPIGVAWTLWGGVLGGSGMALLAGLYFLVAIVGAVVGWLARRPNSEAKSLWGRVLMAGALLGICAAFALGAIGVLG